MSKSKPGGGVDRKVEGVRDSDAPRLIPSVPVGLASSRPPLGVGPPGHTYIVQSQHGGQHHDMKNFSTKLTRPIAPAPPTQGVQTVVGRTVQSSQSNIPSIISSRRGPNEGLVSLNLVSSSGAITHSPISVPVTLPPANVLQLGSSSAVSGSSSGLPQAIPGSIPINMLRATAGGQQPQSQIQAFASNFQAHLPRGTTTLTVPKSSAILRQGGSASLQIPTPALSATVNLPLARQPVLQTVKTSTSQGNRSQSPAVGGLPLPQAQPQDLSRTSFPLHGSIAPVTSGTPGHPMHITLNRMSTPITQDNVLQGRSIPAQPQTEIGSGSLQQRISVSLSSDNSLHQRLTDLTRSNLTFSSQTSKLNTHSLGPQAKVISSQPLAQHMTNMKSVNLAVSTPVMINSMNPAMVTATTTIVSCAPIPVASMQSSTLPLTSSSSLSSALSVSSSEASVLRQEQTTVPTSQTPSGGIIISPEFQSRPPGSIITMTTLASSTQGGQPPSVISHPENRPPRSSHSQQIGIGPTDPMWYQYFVNQQGTQAPLVSQANPTIVRPGTSTFAFLPSQGQKLQSVQTSASSLTATQIAQAVRYNSNMMVMDQLRQQQQHSQLPLHPPFSAVTNSTSSVGEKLASLASRATEASSIYTASVGVQSQMPRVGSNSGGLSAVPVSNPSSSPRPSILRKRTSEATGVVIRKPIFNINQERQCHSPPRLDNVSTSVSSPKPVKNFSPMSENSQSSTDTALSSNDATTPTHNHNDKGKGEGEECVHENGPASNPVLTNNIPASPAPSHTGSLSEASPRKRARKQLLHANEELKDNVSSSDEEMENNIPHSNHDDLLKDETNRQKEFDGEYTDDEGVRWVFNKPRPTYVLLQPECINSKTRHNHFTRHSDVKPKDERRPTVNELSNQKGIAQKVTGWKLYFSASQLEELMEVEMDMEKQFSEVQASLSKIPTQKVPSDEAGKIHEMSQANIQRCQLIQNQLTEARLSMIKTLDHKPRIQEIVSKHMSKRPIKKKERT